MKKRKTANLGFTTLSLLFALAIFSILFISTSCLVMTSVKTSQLSKEYYEASLLAQKHYEMIKASADVLEGHEAYEYGNFIVSVDALNVSEYGGKLYKIIVKVSKGEEILDTIEGVKIIKK